MIDEVQFWMGRDVQWPPTDQFRRNARDLLQRVNWLLAMYRAERPQAPALRVSSGYRPAAINERTFGAAARSHHMTCNAVDLADPDDQFDAWCLASQHLLASYELWLEHPDFTPRWCHLQRVPPRSGRRVFRP